MTSELSAELLRDLERCLRALDGGANVDDALAQQPDADALRPYLELRTRLAEAPSIEPPAGAYAAGRRRLLERIEAAEVVGSGPGLLGRLPRGLAARAAAFAIAGAVLAAGALGGSAAGGFEPARDVLSALRIIDENGSDRTAVPTPEQERPAGGADPTATPAQRPDAPSQPDARPTAQPGDASDEPARPTADAAPDTRATPTPVRDAQATPTPVRDVQEPHDGAPHDGRPDG